MTALQFEERYGDEWVELETLLNLLPDNPSQRHGHGWTSDVLSRDTLRLTELYRRACGHLMLARARAYPAHLVDRLDALTAGAHQRIYYRRDVGWHSARRLVQQTIPAAVRQHSSYLLVAATVFVVPLVFMALLVYRQPELILSMVSADTAASFEDMYSTTAQALGRTRTADTDWTMFGFYIRNNIGVAFQCFAGGLFAGVGSLFFLAYNGAFAGAVGGYLVGRGLATTFFSFVITHSAFELTAIVLSGAAGLRVGYGIIAPGRRSRADALALAARESIGLLCGATLMLIIAAATEAFWSSAQWIPSGVKYGVAAICWAAVIAYLFKHGRAAD
jgi:uncharacterized membrane protein SpoIIM required for sporulation